MMKIAKNKKLTLALLTLLLLIVICAGVLTNYFCSTLFIGEMQIASGKFTVPQNEAYLVAVAKSQNSLEAQALAADYASQGCSGYIWQQDGYFHVVFSAHEKQNDATLIKEKLQENDIKSHILKVNFASYSISEELSTKNHSILQQASSSFFSTFRTLCDLAVGLESNVYAAQAVQEKLLSLQENIKQISQQFQQIFASSQNPQMLSLGEYIADQLECVMLSRNNNLSIKYHAVQLLDIYRNMTQEFNC